MNDLPPAGAAVSGPPKLLEQRGPTHAMHGDGVFADGGGRELAYVALSRARDTSQVYVAADDLDQAVEDLTVEWSADGRQRWVLHVDEPAIDDRARRPYLARRTHSTLRVARLRAEQWAVKAVPPDAEDTDTRLRSLDLQLRLEQVAQRPAPDRGISLDP